MVFSGNNPSFATAMFEAEDSIEYTYDEVPTFIPGLEALDEFDKFFEAPNSVTQNDKRSEIPAVHSLGIESLINTDILSLHNEKTGTDAEKDLCCSEKFERTNNAIPNASISEVRSDNEKSTAETTLLYSDALSKPKSSGNSRIYKPNKK